MTRARGHRRRRRVRSLAALLMLAQMLLLPVYLLLLAGPEAVALALMVPVGILAARLARLDVPVSRALVFGAVTRNSLAVLPLALALPERLALTPFVVVTQTLVELVGMVVLVRLVPALVRDRDPRHSGGNTPSDRKASRP